MDDFNNQNNENQNNAQQPNGYQQQNQNTTEQPYGYQQQNQNTTEQPNYYQQAEYQQTQYQQPMQYSQYEQQYSVNEMPQQKNGLAIASMVLGIVSLVFSCCFPCAPFVSSVVGLILGIVSLKKSDCGGKGMAIAGIILSSISLIVTVFVSICYIIAINTYESSNYLNHFINEFNQYY